jgi:hypothetical protein
MTEGGTACAGSLREGPLDLAPSHRCLTRLSTQERGCRIWRLDFDAAPARRTLTPAEAAEVAARLAELKRGVQNAVKDYLRSCPLLPTRPAMA